GQPLERLPLERLPLGRLIAGYREFRGQRWPQERRLYEALADDQKPRTFVISCCDSRVDPTTNVFVQEE
ncbi:MAG: hypothetical protein ACKVG0_00115, partial [Alphaproteobacteria bacterium]